jgi:hypothetical protein
MDTDAVCGTPAKPAAAGSTATDTPTIVTRISFAIRILDLCCHYQFTRQRQVFFDQCQSHRSELLLYLKSDRLRMTKKYIQIHLMTANEAEMRACNARRRKKPQKIYETHHRSSAHRAILGGIRHGAGHAPPAVTPSGR